MSLRELVLASLITVAAAGCLLATFLGSTSRPTESVAAVKPPAPK